jgi:penicillin-binding protein 2
LNTDVSRLRLTIINLLILSLLATLLARLWYVQVLEQETFRKLATQTSVRLVFEQAPRGFIFDRDGNAFAQNRTALTVAIDISRLDPERQSAVFPQLASILGMTEKEVRDRALDNRIGPFTPRPIALDVPKDTVVYLREHADEYPGVTSLEIPVREYPLNSLGAHVIGHIGKISRDELKTRRASDPARDYRGQDDIGKLGIERFYEPYLRGRPGIRKIAVNAKGQGVEDLGYEPPERGWDAVLTIKRDLQQTTEDALQKGTELARRLVDRDTGQHFKAPGGAVVALDPHTGEVLAMASNPTFDPNLFVGPAPKAALDALNAPEAQFPMLNRATAEAVPPGSTFKPITASAAWDAGDITPNRTFSCPGFLKVGNRTFKDWTSEGHGQVALRKSLVESCDVVYYTLGIELNASRDKLGEHLQAIARTFGFGSPTGIDLQGERAGLVPDVVWKAKRFSHARSATEKLWFSGDSANLAVGQGYLLVTPLQLAVAYEAIANGGTIYRPHLLRCMAKLDVSLPHTSESICEGGTVPESAAPRVSARVPVPPSALDFISQSLAGVPASGTAAAAFSGFPFERVSVAGKTGTAQVKPRQAFSWFAAFAPATDPKIVVVAMVEEGGTGAQIAAPIVRRVIEGYFGLPEGNLEAGARAD